MIAISLCGSSISDMKNETGEGCNPLAGLWPIEQVSVLMVNQALPPAHGLAQVWDFLAYDPATGRFDWTTRPKGAARWRPGSPAGCVRPDGYRVINWHGRSYPAHHLAWWKVHGHWPRRIDHRDRNPGNNAIKNLRECSHSQNMGNGVGRPGRSVPYKGIARTKCGYSAICAGRYIGHFRSAEDAARAYDAAAIERWGEYAAPNFPQERNN